MENSSKNNFWRRARVSGLVVREVIGWILMLIGLEVFRNSMLYLRGSRVIEGFVVTIIGVMVFRGGLQLVKVAVAARALRADRQTESESSADKRLTPAR